MQICIWGFYNINRSKMYDHNNIKNGEGNLNTLGEILILYVCYII